MHAKWLGLAQASKRGPVVAVSPRLAVFLGRWLQETVRPNLAPTTAHNDELFSRLYIAPDLGSRRLIGSACATCSSG